MKTKIKKSLSAILIVMWAYMLISTSKAQTAYVSLDTLQVGDTIHYCTSDYSQVVLYSPTTALTGFHWETQYPISNDFFTDSIILNATNNGPIWFSSNQTPTMALKFFLVGPPSSPGLADVTACGDIFSYPLNALNPGSFYTWSTGATTQSITATSAGVYWVHMDNGCGIMNDTAIITVNHTNDANLGSDQTICLNDTLPLTSGNTNIVTYQWSTSSTSSTIAVAQTNDYAVTTTDVNGCVSADTMHLTVNYPYDQQEICYASFDTIVYKNRINWTQHLSVDIDSLEIDKEVAAGVFAPIGVVPNNETSFVDMNSTPQSNSSSYTMRVIDACGNRSPMSPYHRTITLIVSTFSDTNQVNIGFTWNNYEGVSVSTYTLYGIRANGQIDVIASNLVPAPNGQPNLYNWNAPSNPYVKFFVGFYEDCNSKIQTLVKSNYLTSPIIGSIDDMMNSQIAIFPTLTNGNIHIETNVPISKVDVYTITGQLLLTSRERDININASGLYILQITLPQGKITRKVIVQ